MAAAGFPVELDAHAHLGGVGHHLAAVAYARLYHFYVAGPQRFAHAAYRCVFALRRGQLCFALRRHDIRFKRNGVLCVCRVLCGNRQAGQGSASGRRNHFKRTRHGACLRSVQGVVGGAAAFCRFAAFSGDLCVFFTKNAR